MLLASRYESIASATPRPPLGDRAALNCTGQGVLNPVTAPSPGNTMPRHASYLRTGVKAVMLPFDAICDRRAAFRAHLRDAAGRSHLGAHHHAHSTGRVMHRSTSSAASSTCALRDRRQVAVVHCIYLADGSLEAARTPRWRRRRESRCWFSSCPFTMSKCRDALAHFKRSRM